MAVVVGFDGAPAWRVVRVAATVLVGAAVWWTVRRGPRLRTAALVLLGLVTVPVGVGIGGPFLVKTGMTLRSLAGAALLVGGLALVVGGIRGVLRLGRRRATVPATMAVVVALLVLVWSLGQGVAATNPPHADLGAETPDDVGFAYRDVAFPAADGVGLSAWYIPSGNGAAIVLRHGAGSTRSGVLDHAAVLAGAGYGVLLTDARGHGRSDGRAMDFGWYGDEDIAGAVAFLQGLDDVDPDRIGVVGMSMGGEEAVGAASVEGIRGVVAEGATNRTAEDKAWLSDAHGWRGALSEGVEAMTYGFTDLLTDADPPTSLRAAVRAAAPRPILLIAGGDVEDEVFAAEHIRTGAPDSVEVWVVPGAGHTAGLDTRPGEWTRRVLAFLDLALRERSQTARD